MKVNAPDRLGVRQCGNCLEVRSFYIALWQRKWSIKMVFRSTQMHMFRLFCLLDTKKLLAC